jgi:Glyoxalase-like domain
MNTTLDHLVVIAHTLDEGVAWCEATLGVTPGPGGKHALMGTHNRLLRIDGPGFERTYLEIIAIDPAATPARQPPLRRWFDMDDAALMERVRRDGPQLLHWVARTDVLDAALLACAVQGWDRGPALAASRATPEGLLQWRISVRDDGQRLLDGVLPTLIEWGQVHPTDHMAASGVALQSLTLAHPEAARLHIWSHQVGMAQTSFGLAPARLAATFQTPKGLVVLGGPG